MDFFPYPAKHKVTVDHKVLSYENEGGINSDIGFQIEDCIAKDNVQGFLSLSKGYLFMLWINKEKRKNPQHGMSKLLQLICDHHAVDCAIAVILGKTPVRVDLHAASEEGLLPLHYAALSLSYDLSRLFLYFGAETFLRCNAVGHRLYGLLPLEVSLETLSNHVKWTPEESIFKLVIILSMLHRSNQLYTIELLAWNTKDVKQVFLRCAKEGKLIELATLLVVAQEMVMREKSKIPRAKGSVNAFTHDIREDDYIVLENMTLRQYIASEIALLIAEENRFSLGTCHALVQKENKKKMMSVMLLLEVFQRAGSYLHDTVMLYSSYGCQFDCSRIPFVANVFASRLEQEGFALTNEVMIQKPEDCFSAELLKMLAETQVSDAIPTLVCRGALRYISSRSMSSTKTAKELRRRTLRYVSGEKQELSFGIRPFHALRTYSSCATQPPIAMESQVKKTYEVTTNCVAKFLSSKQLSFLFVLKKGIRRI